MSVSYFRICKVQYAFFNRFTFFPHNIKRFSEVNFPPHVLLLKVREIWILVCTYDHNLKVMCQSFVEHSLREKTSKD